LLVFGLASAAVRLLPDDDARFFDGVCDFDDDERFFVGVRDFDDDFALPFFDGDDERDRFADAFLALFFCSHFKSTRIIKFTIFTSSC